ncbi:unnamed protein product, partial [marine sediment metagenome]
SPVASGRIVRAEIPSATVTINQTILKMPANIKPFRDMRVVLDAKARFAYGGMSVSPSRKSATRPTISISDAEPKPAAVAADASLAKVAVPPSRWNRSTNNSITGSNMANAVN